LIEYGFADESTSRVTGSDNTRHRFESPVAMGSFLSRNLPSRMDRATFISVFGDLYEHSSWIAASVWDQGLSQSADHADGLLRRMKQVVEEAGSGPQRALLRAHPDLAGRVARAGGLTDASHNEQAGAGLDQCSEAEFDAFQELNKRYTKKFAFPFIMAVKGNQRATILEAFRRRVENEPDTEFEMAMDQVHCIARYRLEALGECED
jgi:OHCU decarboxylase